LKRGEKLELFKEKIIFSERPEIINLEELNPNIKRYKCYMCYEGEANRFLFSKEVLTKMMETVLGQPVLTYYFPEFDKFGGHEGDSVSKNGIAKRTPKPYGIGFADYTQMPKWETYKGKEYLTTTTYLWTHRFSEELSDLDEKIKNKEIYQSMEVELDYYEDNGIKVVTNANCIGLVMIGVTPAFTNSSFEKFTLDENIIKDIENFKNEYENIIKGNQFFISKELLGTESTIQIDKSKESLSDNAWGDEDKSELKKTCLMAKNWKTLCKSVFLKLEEGWGEGKEGSLGYPVMELIDNKVVYNKYGLSSAKGYATKNNETNVLTSLNKIYKHLELDWDAEKDKKKEGEDNKMAKIEFSLNSEQIREILDNSLTCYKYVANWGETNKYWLQAYDETYIYVRDYEEDKCFRITYELTDDNIANINMDTKEGVIRGNFIPVGQEPNSDGLSDNDMDIETMKSKLQEMTEKLSKMQEEMASKDDSIKSKDKELNESFTKISSLETGLLDMKNAMEENKNKIAEYEEMFKKQEEEDKKNKMKDVLTRDEFSMFTDDEKEEFVNKFADKTIEEFENEMYSVFGKRAKDMIKFSKDEGNKNVNFIYTSYFHQKEKKNKDIYEELRNNNNNN
jgi:hypothetical protein